MLLHVGGRGSQGVRSAPEVVGPPSIGDIENVDVTEAITRLTNEEVQLEASLLAVARLGNLSLINFLG